MKTNSLLFKLTAFTMLMLPPQFCTGVYGMNFVNIPELDFEYGYFILVGGIVAFWILSLLYFWWNKLLIFAPMEDFE
jgi:magnesium transporter